MPADSPGVDGHGENLGRIYQDTFTPMPSLCYVEFTKLLLNYTSNNIPKADKIQKLVKDTWDARMAKLQLSADSFIW